MMKISQCPMGPSCWNFRNPVMRDKAYIECGDLKLAWHQHGSIDAMDGKWNCMTSGIHILHNRLIERVMLMPRVSEFRVLGFRVMLMQSSLRLKLMF